MHVNLIETFSIAFIYLFVLDVVDVATSYSVSVFLSQTKAIEAKKIEN